MPFAFHLPDVGEGIDQAEVVEWYIAVGDEVVEDQKMVDVQTDKAIVELPCPTTGVVVELKADGGDMVPVGEVLAVFEPAAGAKTTNGHGGDAEPMSSAPELTPPAVPASAGAHEEDADAVAATATRRPLASPAVRRLAHERGIDLTTVCGSGRHGRIVREDLQGQPIFPTAATPVQLAALEEPPPVPVRPAVGGPSADEVVPLRGTRRAIARTLSRAWQEIPHVIDYREVDATALVRARKALKARATAAGDDQLAKALTPTPLLVKMVATALRKHPHVNASIDLEREEITLRGRVNIGIATATEDGLIVPVVHDADRLSVHEIAREIARLGVAARERRLTQDVLTGGTFTLNNYGGLGIWLGTPIIPPPQVANFGIGRMDDKPVVRDGQIVIRPVFAVACSGDHRILDGHTLAAFVTDVVRLIEDPSLMLGELV